MPSTCCRRGFSVAEALLTSFLVLLVLGAVASLVRQYGQVANHARLKDSSLRALLGLTGVGRELKSALSISSPASGVASTVNFTRVRPDATGRFPFPLPTSPPAFDPRLPEMNVVYQVVGRELLRQVDADTPELVAENVVGFSCRYVGADQNVIQLRLRVQEAADQRVFQVITVLKP